MADGVSPHDASSASAWMKVLGVGLSAAVTGALLGVAWVAVSGSSTGLWLTARAAGLTSYLLLTLVTIAGLVLSHPARHRLRWPNAAQRLRVHAALTVFTLVFVVLHIVVLALDPWAKVGWLGAVLPFGSQYRPLPVTLGLLSLWAGIITGATAALAGRFTGRIWRPLHRFSASVWVLAWLHGVFAGSDTAAWMWMYAITGFLVVATAGWRYSAVSRADKVRELADDRRLARESV